jgi:hypothetical protein
MSLPKFNTLIHSCFFLCISQLRLHFGRLVDEKVIRRKGKSSSYEMVQTRVNESDVQRQKNQLKLFYSKAVVNLLSQQKNSVVTATGLSQQVHKQQWLFLSRVLHFFV